MIRRVYERCSAVRNADKIVVATDDERIIAACREFGCDAEMTDAGHRSGTDRVAEAASRFPGYEIVVNVQGDEPFLEPDAVAAVIDAFQDKGVAIATAATPILDHTAADDPNIVKAVVAANGNALYFSRAPIPYFRNHTNSNKEMRLRHLGLYGFRREILRQVTALPPSALEKAESLEQLRWLEAGYSIRCVVVDSRSRGIDTPEDLTRIVEE